MIPTLRQAAELTGKSKSTLTRAIKSGRLSASWSEEGTYAIDPAELARVYTFKESLGALHDAPRNSKIKPDDAALVHLRLSILIDERNRERTTAEREREQLLATIEDLRIRLDRAEQQHAIAITNEPNFKKKGFWSLWRRK